jgi:hypothetical protein
MYTRVLNDVAKAQYKLVRQKYNFGQKVVRNISFTLNTP